MSADSLGHLLPDSWGAVCQSELTSPYFAELQAFVARERAQHDVFPPAADVFAAFKLTSFSGVRVVILGQDPYFNEGQAHGLSFSVPRGVKPPPSLVNIFKELADDVGVVRPEHGNLESWARQGVLLLNTVLTVRSGAANSHRRQGWEQFTDAVISKLNDRQQPCVFVLWGKPAQTKLAMIDEGRHSVLASAHPSPLSARNGFFGSQPFSQINAALQSFGGAPIDWRLD
ncbi:MAG: uracil-DNA glycosylase [Pirellulaceae bacterium]|nr:uracil-DNA glycosylase [Pirellulaceae bacterium]